MHHASNENAGLASAESKADEHSKYIEDLKEDENAERWLLLEKLHLTIVSCSPW